jgi:hypothetical protein
MRIERDGEGVIIAVNRQFVPSKPEIILAGRTISPQWSGHRTEVLAESRSPQIGPPLAEVRDTRLDPPRAGANLGSWNTAPARTEPWCVDRGAQLLTGPQKFNRGDRGSATWGFSLGVFPVFHRLRESSAVWVTAQGSPNLRRARLVWSETAPMRTTWPQVVRIEM